MIKYIKRKLRTTTGLMMGVMVTLSLVLGVSYSTFVITTDKYKASEMRISDLLYGINITNVENASISGTEVTIQSGKIGIVNVTITSLNEIDSNYSLEYKIKSGSGKVTYLGSSTYEPTGSINKNGTSVYTKTITIGIAATSTMKIEFNVSGGYTYNSTPSTQVGYTKISQKAHKVKVTSTTPTYGGVTNGEQLINNGSTATITLNPNPGYEYDSENSTCSGTASGNTLTISTITSAKTCIVSFKVSNPYANGTLANKIYADNPVVLERTDFSTTLGSETPTNNTIYKASGGFTEDGSEVYYFAGNVSNNWVKFGKVGNNVDLYWRIIRTNEDKSVRLLYAGRIPDETALYLSEEWYNDGIYDDPMAVGYMYGTRGSLSNNRLNTNSSDAKTVIDTWYSRGLNVKTDDSGNTYDKYLSRTAIYCNDRSGGSYSTTGDFNYAAYNRLVESDSPSYACGMKPDKSGLYSDAHMADKFTAEAASKQNKIGNGQLQYPVALMTMDEIVMAGGKYNTSNKYVYYNLNSINVDIPGTSWWTMTPTYTDSDGIGCISSTDRGNLYITNWGSDSSTIRPVLSLKSCVAYKSGNGTVDTPYEVSIDSTCASKEN